MVCTLLWFCGDLRLRDHPALVRAAQRGSIIPVFILDPNLLHLNIRWFDCPGLSKELIDYPTYQDLRFQGLQSLYKGFDETQQEPESFPEHYQAWCDGLTGFPLVDASARCLKTTGFLNFRTRALHSSFLTNLLNIDWWFGALHGIRHLIGGETCIDHYQHQMQAGITHCVDKRWTRIYSAEQYGVDRCDPDAEFIRRWIPELKDIP
ncbi:MAG: FAD-binding domain-containing protein [Gloeobacterales cyanobacterium]